MIKCGITITDAQQICIGAYVFLMEWIAAQDVHHRGSDDTDRNSSVCWQIPVVGAVKCNADAAFRRSLNLSSYGCCVRNSNGDFFYCYARLDSSRIICL
jgi:hypothetical protein